MTIEQLIELLERLDGRLTVLIDDSDAYDIILRMDNETAEIAYIDIQSIKMTAETTTH